ncbi:hypothetical protein OG21DRAFT_186479 [Imleria badia]|nr:hypothetical protein OG21DRAFT_186479 [Imleria badia]
MDNPWATYPHSPEPEPETTDANVPDDDWSAAWGATDEPQHPDQWESARQDKEKLNRAVSKRSLQNC